MIDMDRDSPLTPRTRHSISIYLRGERRELRLGAAVGGRGRVPQLLDRLLLFDNVEDIAC